MSGTVPISKDEEKQRPVPSLWRNTFSEIIQAFKRGHFRLTQGVAGVRPVSEDDAIRIASNIKNYGARLASLPEETWQTSVCQWMRSYWDGNWSAGKLINKGNAVASGIQRGMEGMKDFAQGESVSYGTTGKIDDVIKGIKEYFNDDDFSDSVSDTGVLGRLIAGDATENDVRGFLGGIKDTKAYKDMGYSSPDKFVSDVKSATDKSYLGRASDRSREGTGVSPDKRGFLDTIHDRNAAAYKAGE